MHFTKILSSILLAATALASPLGSRNATLSKRESSDGQAGAYIATSGGVEFTQVRGTVKMPDLTKADKNTLVSYWIGIDGLGTDRVIQAGFDAKKDSDGTVTYQAFYEWSPEKQKFIPTSDFKASVGDEVAITLAITRAGTTAEAGFTNKKSLETYTTALFFSPDEDSDAEGINAQWVMEAAPKTTLANFGEIDFTDCSATDADGSKHTVEGGSELELVRDGTTLATGTIIGASSVIIKYREP